MGLDVYSSCEGAVQISPSRDDAELENLLVDSVWASDKHIDTALASLHSLISESERGLPGSSVSKVIIFASAMRADSAPGLALLEAVGKSLSARNISPIFVVLQQPWSMQTSQSQNSIALKLSNYLLYPEHSAATKAESAKALGFANVCRDRDWEVILVRH